MVMPFQHKAEWKFTDGKIPVREEEIEKVQ